MLPYSRGIMASSLLATGVTTEEAYRLATEIQRRLLGQPGAGVDASDLVAITLDTLATEPDLDRVADRWKAWRQARRSGRPIVVVLGGAPGSGKSTLATNLAVRLDITRVVTTDAMREVLRVVVPATVLPELHHSTYELIEPDRLEPFAGFDRQSAAVGEATGAVATRLATEHRSMVVEGVHVVPGDLGRRLADHPAAPIVVERLIVVDEQRHQDHLEGRGRSEPLRGATRYLDGFSKLRATQEHLVELAHANGVDVVDIHAATELTQNIVDEIADRLEPRAGGAA